MSNVPAAPAPSAPPLVELAVIARRESAKTAADIEAPPEQEADVHSFASKLRPGDVINYVRHPLDEMRHDVGKGLRRLLINKPIEAFTGHDDSHTAMYVGHVDGVPHIAHNSPTDAKGAKGTLILEPLHKVTRGTEMKAYRPDADDEEAQRAADYAVALTKRPETKFRMSDIVLGQAPHAIVDRMHMLMRGHSGGDSPMRRAATMMSNATQRLSCSPTDSYCSLLPVYAYGHTRGIGNASQMLLGDNLKLMDARVQASPARIARTIGKPLASFRIR